jgi:hypothetical protein
MYLANKAVVGNPVLNLIDESAEQAGFYPVSSRPAPAPRARKAAPADDELDLEESPSVA